MSDEVSVGRPVDLLDTAYKLAPVVGGGHTTWVAQYLESVPDDEELLADITIRIFTRS